MNQANNKTVILLVRFLQVLVLVVLLSNLYFISKRNGWSPIDEYAHMDYIEKIGQGHFPKLSDSISEEIIQDILQHPDRSVTGKYQSKAELGLAIYSYQAKHPPIYYALMSIPNMFMKFLNFEVFERVQVLRYINFALYALGIFLLLAVFAELRKLSFHVSVVFVWVVVLFSFIFFAHERYGLGNNVLSPLFVHTSLFFLLRAFYKDSFRNLCLSLLVISMTCCCALTNVLLLPAFLLIVYYKLIQEFSIKKMLITVLVFLPSLAILIFWKFNSTPEPTVADFINSLLKVSIPAGMVDYPTFYSILSKDLFTIHFFSYTYKVDVFMLIMFVSSLGISFLNLRKLVQQQVWLLLLWIVLIMWLVELYILNRYIDSVTWVAFRHYLGFVGILFSVVFSWIQIASGAKVNSKIMIP